MPPSSRELLSTRARQDAQGGAIATMVYTAVFTAVIVFVTDKLFVIHVSEDDQCKGRNLVDHDERRYEI